MKGINSICTQSICVVYIQYLYVFKRQKCIYDYLFRTNIFYFETCVLYQSCLQCIVEGFSADSFFVKSRYVGRWGVGYTVHGRLQDTQIDGHYI